MKQNALHSTEKQRVCSELKDVVNDGTMGDILEKLENLVEKFYADVQDEARQSFDSAKSAAKIGFWVLIATLAYALTFDALNRFSISGLVMMPSSLTVAGVGVVSGMLIEGIASINFWLYSRSSRQFNAFHICLERTHRYVLAHKISTEIKENRDQTVRDLVCIMANASMITRQDIESSNYSSEARKDRQIQAMSAKVGT